MDFSLNDHQKLIRDTVRQFMEAEVRPAVKQRDREERFPSAEISKIAALGCCGMTVPEEWGGPGLDTISYVLMLEEVARIDAAMATSLSVTNSAVQLPLLNFGSDAQKKKYLYRLATGEILGAFCLTEPQAGSDAAAIQTRASAMEPSTNCRAPRPGSPTAASPAYSSSSRKPIPPQAGRESPPSSSSRISPASKPDATKKKWASAPRPRVEIILNDCEVPLENRLGEEGQGLKIALSALDGGRIGIAAVSVGLAQGALEEAVKYAKQRRAFGKNIADFQAIQWMIADMQTEIEAARALLYNAAWLKDAHPTRLGTAASRAKLYASEMANRVAAKAVQIHGSVGYSRETDVERMYRDARVLTIYEGTSEIQRIIIARALLQHSNAA